MENMVQTPSTKIPFNHYMLHIILWQCVAISMYVY